MVGVKEAEPDISSDIAQIKLVKDVKKNDSTYRIKAELGEEAQLPIIDLIRSKGLHVTKISLTKPTLGRGISGIYWTKPEGRGS